jgi:Rap guanine nucleotide exchange factor 4
MVMAGTPEKMIEHLLETRLDAISFEDKNGDTLLQDFILTYPIFISWKNMCNQLMRYYRIDELNARQEKEFIVANKRRVVRFMHYWFTISGEAFLKNAIVWSFVDDIMEALQRDFEKYKTFEDEISTIKIMTEAKAMYAN